MSLHSGHHAGHEDPDFLRPTIWFVVALGVMVAFSYWLNAS